MSLDLQGKRVIVTGAGGGIGRATARLVAARGGFVMCTDVDSGALKETIALVQNESPDIEVVAEVLDSTDYEAAVRIVTGLSEEWGDFDGLVNVAGVIFAKPLAETDLSDLERIFRINVGGVLVMSRAVLPRLCDGGVIINVSSSSAQHVSPGLGAYGASKAANIYLTRAFAAEVANRGIRVCGVGPGAVDTAMPRSIIPPGDEGERMLAEAVDHAQLIGRLARPEEIAGAIGYLLSDEASYITGSTLWIDGGTSAL